MRTKEVTFLFRVEYLGSGLGGDPADGNDLDDRNAFGPSKKTRKLDREGCRDQVLNFNREQQGAAALLTLNRVLRNQHEPTLSLYQRECIARSLSEGKDVCGFGYGDFFDEATVGQGLKINPDMLDGVQDGTISFTNGDVPGYGKENDESSSGNIATAFLALTNAAASYFTPPLHQLP